ncbi:OsmC family protein [Streptomyces monomycini]|uniref:OsmC family protein n=1 Tax=Streptomyces monomycini TaxID=371720 RepID=UPI0004AB856E|nr:OsmC family protein [Streptomyces monomycini]
MRNGFNISSSSEFVDEIRRDAQEAQFHYHAGARFKPGRGLRGWTDPAILGRIKSARRFELDLADGWQDGTGSTEADEYTPLDLALAAVGVCSLKTAIVGGSSRGINFDTIDMDVSASFLEREKGFLPTARVRQVTYDIRTESDADPGLIGEVTQQVLDRSPNHRTVKDPTELHFRSGTRSLPWQAAEEQNGAAPDGAAAEATLSREVKWISGTQFESTGAQGCRAPLRVDEAKQFAGVDWAPNPQEYIVIALASELASLSARRQQVVTGSAGVWTVRAHGLLDLRGLMLVGSASSVGFRNITCTVEGPSELSSAEIEEYFRAAVAESALVELFRLPHQVEVRLTHNGAAGLLRQ